MKGIQHIEVSNRKVKFKLDLIRNITIIRGESGTGKTTLYNMISDYTRLQEASGVNLSSEKPCVALMDMDWQNQLSNTRDSIVLSTRARSIFHLPSLPPPSRPAITTTFFLLAKICMSFRTA